MFDKLKAMGAVASLLRDKDKLKATTERVKQVSESVRASGEAGGGVVRVTVNGQMKLVGVEIGPALAAGMAADDRTRELAGNLICQAADEAMRAARDKMTEIIRREARGVGRLPGRDDRVVVADLRVIDEPPAERSFTSARRQAILVITGDRVDDTGQSSRHVLR